ncbi:hypothetical protein I4U23_002683 [Adineta vaga]|nr:hypothetical protein I4U23_002683 [Adineta vaga]
MNPASKWSHGKTEELSTFATIERRIQLLRKSVEKQGVHSVCLMNTCGFKYTGDGDKAVCEHCELEVSNWTLAMDPLKIHTERSPNCSFMQSLKSSLPKMIHSSSSSSSLSSSIRNLSKSNETEIPSIQLKIETNELTSSTYSLYETPLLQQVRRRTFSHWPHRTIPSTAQMIEAGFFSCNVDDPCEVHKTLSPKCPYVTAKLIRPAASSITIVNENATSVVSNLDPLRSNEIVFTAACNPAYTEISKRHASFEKWPEENLPAVDDLVRAGFFYTGTKSIVTCFYCNGSLQNWGPNDNPMIEHARWFPHCAYAKQLCGDDLYRKIQESKRAQQERERANESSEKATTDAITSDTGQLLIPDESTLSRLVAARLDLPISQRLLDQNLKLSIIKRCWEDQRRLKQHDFTSEEDLYVACTILQKQIEHIDGKKENIVIPSIKMKQIREQNEARVRDQSSNPTQIISNSTDAEMTTLPQSLTNESQSSAESPSKSVKSGSRAFTSSSNEQDQSPNVTPSNPLCLPEELDETIKREQSFVQWPYDSPDRNGMLIAGWYLDKTNSRDYTFCRYCGVKYYNWQPEDNPRTIHSQLSPSCPYLLSSNPMRQNLVQIKSLAEIYTQQNIATKLSQPTTTLILPSNSPYSFPSERERTFNRFPSGRPSNVVALVQSGFYYTGIGTLLQCYHCSNSVNDFHQLPSDEINRRHHSQFPQCHFARLLPQQGGLEVTNNTDLCSWCSTNPKILVVYPCQHLAVCDSCSQLIHTCPICGIVAEAFMRILA